MFYFIFSEERNVLRIILRTFFLISRNVTPPNQPKVGRVVQVDACLNSFAFQISLSSMLITADDHASAITFCPPLAVIKVFSTQLYFSSARLAMDEEVFRRIQPRDYLKRFLDNDVRPDSRSPTMARKLTMTTGSINTAVGSAMLKLGRTTVVAGVQATLVEPSSSAPNDGVVEYSVEILATASFNFRQVRTSDDSLVLAHNLRRWLDPYIDRPALCVEPELLVWHLCLTVYVIDNDGNVDDAVIMAAVAAMKNVLLPAITLRDDEACEALANGSDGSRGRMDVDSASVTNRSAIAVASAERTVPLQFDDFPLVVSFALFEDKPLLDPCAEEEAVMDSRVTFVLNQSGELRAVDKPGGVHLSGALFKQCLYQAKSYIPVLLEKLGAT